MCYGVPGLALLHVDLVCGFIEIFVRQEPTTSLFRILEFSRQHFLLIPEFGISGNERLDDVGLFALFYDMVVACRERIVFLVLCLSLKRTKQQVSTCGVLWKPTRASLGSKPVLAYIRCLGALPPIFHRRHHGESINAACCSCSLLC